MKKLTITTLFLLFAFLILAQDSEMKFPKFLKKELKESNKEIKENPLNSNAYFNKGLVLYFLGEMNEAHINFSKAIEFNPKDDLAYYNRAETELKLDNYEKAVEDYTTAIEISNDHIYYLGRGRAYYIIGENEKAISDLNFAINDENKIESFDYRLRGLVKVLLEDFVGAIQDFSIALDLTPKNYILYYERADAYFLAEINSKALIDINTYFKKTKEPSANAIFRRATIRQYSDDFVGAISDYTQVIKLQPDATSSYYLRGICKEKSNDLSGALLDYDKLIKLEPNDGFNFYNRALLKIRMDDSNGACFDFSQAFKLGEEFVLEEIEQYCDN